VEPAEIKHREKIRVCQRLSFLDVRWRSASLSLSHSLSLSLTFPYLYRSLCGFCRLSNMSTIFYLRLVNCKESQELAKRKSGN